MKVIDKTPFQNDKGEISLVDRAQGALKYGFSWHAELEAQKLIIAQLDRVLEKEFTLIRNFTLPGVEVVEPIILIGPPGAYIIYVTPLSGFYEAKGDQWNMVNNGRSTPAAKNPMRDVKRLAMALQVYLERQGVHLPNPVEPVLIASSPAMHIDSMRPAIRVLQSDGIRSFANTLLQSRPVLTIELVRDLTNRIVEPRPDSKAQANPVAPVVQPAPSRAQAIFRASEQAAPSVPNELGFAFEETPAQNPGALNPAQRKAPQTARKPSGRLLGMSVAQLAILIVIFMCWVCLMASAIIYYLFFLNS